MEQRAWRETGRGRAHGAESMEPEACGLRSSFFRSESISILDLDFDFAKAQPGEAGTKFSSEGTPLFAKISFCPCRLG